MEKIVFLDCSSGGGQLVRTALTLSTILKIPVEFENIRKNRPNPGLQAQHLAGVKALEQMGAKTKNAVIGASKMSFIPPEKIDFEKLFLDVGTAGSVTLVMQTLLLPLVFSNSAKTVEIKGGTHVKWSPTADYFEKVFLPSARKFGVNAKMRLLKHGFYPQGGGIIEITVKPSRKLSSTEFLGKGKLETLEGISAVSNLPLEIAERQKKSILKTLVSENISPKIKVESVQSESQGTFVFLQAGFETITAGFSSLGEKGKPADKVGEECALKFLEFSNSQESVDEHLGDQLIPIMALAGGKSSINAKLTDHFLSNIRVCEQFLPVKFSVEGRTGEIGSVEVEGIGFEL
ncbi:MAG: RNA 3'-terminal phosphate cyclase [Candidatus Micrarchaeota archaeon]